MGEVYRARDARLDRDVAIKVLPAAFAQDADRIARFEREAKAIAALSHPNVLAVFDTGLHDGHAYVVTELLEGDTLAARLKAGPLPLRKAIDWGSQVARGLAAAHDKGVIHRDLKPDNIFITADGHAKILDFGLAKALDPVPQGFSPAAATMAVAPITDAGMVMGTVGYMSPEQVRGQAIDARSDLFSFGAVLYEMLTGERAFRRDTGPETMTAILRDDPPDVSATRTQLTPALDRIVRHCLEKQPTERFQTARDVAFALDALSGSGATPASGAAPVTAHGTRITTERIAWSALVLTLAAAIAVLSLKSDGQGVAPPPYIATILLPDGVSLPTGLAQGRKLAISPDGRQLAFVGTSNDRRRPRLWLHSLDRGSATVVDGSEGASGPFWSPDSRFVAFRIGNQLMRARAAGGAATLVGLTSGSGTWNADDVIVVDDENNATGLKGSAALRMISKNGGDASDVLRAEAGNRILFPSFLPDGQHFLFTYGSPLFPDTGLYLGHLGSPDRTLLARARFEQDAVNVLYAAGQIVSVRNRQIVARSFDPTRFVVGGDVNTIAGPVDAAIPGSAAFSVSHTGVLVYQPSSSRQGARLAWFDRRGRQVSVLGDEGEYTNVELSPDGSQLLVALPDRALGTRDIWVVDVARGVRTRLTFDPSEERSAVWTADGKGVVYTSKGLNLYTRTVGAGTETPFIIDGVSKDPRGFSPDGRFFAYRATGPRSGNDLWIRPTDGDHTPYPFLSTPFDETEAVFSPDGKWLAYQSEESGRSEVYVTSFPSGSGKWQISTVGGAFPRWRRDGKELFYLAPDNRMMSTRVSGAAGTFTVAAAEPLFLTTAMPGPGFPYDVSLDGERFVINSAISSSAPPMLTIVFNWPQLLTKQESR